MDLDQRMKKSVSLILQQKETSKHGQHCIRLVKADCSDKGLQDHSKSILIQGYKEVENRIRLDRLR